jgi:hypothetical protein
MIISQREFVIDWLALSLRKNFILTIDTAAIRKDIIAEGIELVATRPSTSGGGLG